MTHTVPQSQASIQERGVEVSVGSVDPGSGQTSSLMIYLQTLLDLEDLRMQLGQGRGIVRLVKMRFS